MNEDTKHIVASNLAAAIYIKAESNLDKYDGVIQTKEDDLIKIYERIFSKLGKEETK